MGMYTLATGQSGCAHATAVAGRNLEMAKNFDFYIVWARVLPIAGIVAVLGVGFVGAASGQEWGQPVWSDEFNSTEAGAPPDASKWVFDVGGSGWGNHELEFYCGNGTGASLPTSGAGASSSAATVADAGGCDPQHPNAFQDGRGHLVIRATKIAADPAHAGSWTSARMKTMGLKDFQYGRMEACIKLPVGAGLWPAFWMLGTAGKWPQGGEMDIMENIPEKVPSGRGLGPEKVESTIHGPSSAARGLFSLTEIYTFPAGQRVDDTEPGCHVYGAVWSPFMVQMYVDDWRKPFFIRTAADVPREGRWVYNAPFYFLQNLAVGGDWPGPPDNTTPTTADMVVDYVRVYKAGRVEGPKMTVGRWKPQDGGGVSTALKLESAAGTGYVFLACVTEPADGTCSVDSGNTLDAAVVDFRATGTQTAKITVTRGAPSSIKNTAAHVTITAYTVSGEQSSVVLLVE
jgi:beta-glucanase (GH16 family)